MIVESMSRRLVAEPSHMLLFATSRPLSARIRTLFNDGGSVVCIDGTAGSRPIYGTSPSIARSGAALVTWADLDSESPSSMAARIDAAVSQAGVSVERLDIVLLPYASLMTATGVEYLWSSSGGPPVEALGAFEPLAASLVARGTSSRLRILPMVLDDTESAVADYSSLAHRLIRTAKVLAREVQDKVPDYFSLHPLRVQRKRTCAMRLMRLSDVPRWTMDRDDAPAVAAVEASISFAQLAAAVESGGGPPLAVVESASELSELDALVDALVWRSISHGDCPPVDVDAAARAETITDAIANIASQPARPWETRYRSQPLLDLNTAGLRRTRARQEPAESDVYVPAYYEGGAGELVVLIPAFSVAPGYFAEIAAALSNAYRVVVWDLQGQPGGDGSLAGLRHLAVEAAAMGQVAATARGVHLVTWCSGARLAAAFLEAHPGVVTSIALLTPGLNSHNGHTPDYDSLVRFYSLLTSHPSAAPVIVRKARESLNQRSASQLEQFLPGAAGRRSPLQYHPVDFFKSFTGDILADPGSALGWARQSLDNLASHDDVLRRLGHFDGPILTILGTHDSLIHYGDMRATCRAFHQPLVMTVAGGNHFLLAEHGQVIADVLRRFMCGLPLDAGLPLDGRYAVESGRHLWQGSDAPDSCGYAMEQS